MKRQTYLVIVLAFLLFASLAAFHQASITNARGTRRTFTSVQIASGTTHGGDYQLQVYTRPASSGGAGYLLLGPASPTLRGDGCCCTYLPCVVKAP
jgi:hypothetical protein